MAGASRAQILFGTDEPVSQGRMLRAGPLSAALEGGHLRGIRFAGVEAIRGLFFLVRDENWGTHPAEIGSLQVDEQPGTFTVSYRGRCAAGDQALIYDVSIEARASATGCQLSFRATMKPITRFRTNRAGFVVLHPLVGVVGQPVEVLHVDGRRVHAVFPSIIDPVQPFKDIRALTHEVLPGVKVTCEMQGDTFEMEDQRNWTDASFKTYVRPLALPYPYELEPQTPVSQSVTLTFQGEPRVQPGGAATAAAVDVALAEEDRVLPDIGLGVRPEELDETDQAIAFIHALEPGFLLCHLDLSRGHGAPELRRYAELSHRTGVRVALEVALGCQRPPADELPALAALVHQADLKPAAVLVSPAADMRSVGPGITGPELPGLDEIYRAARMAFPEARLGGGTLAYFTELNRKRPPSADLDFISHTTCPIVHAADDTSVMQTLEALPSIVQSVRALAGHAAYRLGPIAIGMRQNPYGAAPAENPEHRRVAMARIDPRQRALFGAAFYLGYASAVVRGGIEALALCAPTGAFGLCDPAAQRVFPAYHVVATLAQAAGAPRVHLRIASGVIDGLAYRRGNEVHLLLANLTAQAQTVTLGGRERTSYQLTLLDEHSAEALSFGAEAWRRSSRERQGPLSLSAHAVAHVRVPA